MKVPRRFRWRWRCITAKFYSLAVGRWIVGGFRDLRGRWRDTRHRVLAIKLDDVRSTSMREVLGDKGAEDLYNDLLRSFIVRGSSRRIVRDDHGSQQE